MADKDPFAQYIAPEAPAGSDPFAQYVEPEPETPAKRSFLGEAAHRAAEAGHNFVENVKNIPSTSAGRIWENAKALAQPFKQAGQAVADEVTHPVRTLQGSPAAQFLGLSTPEAVRHHEAVGNEFERGFESTVPLAGLAHERLTGFPETSAEDAAEAPYAHGAGAVTGMAAAPLVGQGAGLAKDAGAAVSGAVRKAGQAAIERSAARGATPIWDAVKEGGGDLLHGHVIKPAVRVGATAADELGAALARKMLRKPSVPAEYVPPEAPATPGPVTTDVTPPNLLNSAPIEAGPITAPDNRLLGPITPEAPAPAAAQPAAAVAPQPVADVEAIMKPDIPARKPAWEPSRADAEFARKLGMTTEKYREMMVKRSGGLTAKEVENVKVAKLIRLVSDRHSAKSVEAAAQEAISAGADPSVIQRITTKMVGRAAKKAINAD